MRIGFSAECRAIVAVVALFAMGCSDELSKNAAPTATALESAKPASAAALPFVVDDKSSKASWTMEAPFEKIFGEIAGGISGNLFIDPSDLKSTTGLFEADLGKLDLFQQVRENEKDEKSAFKERTRSEKQNEHAKAWLQLEKPEFTKAQLKIKKLETDTPDVGKLTGAERKVSGKLTGDLLVHGRSAERTVNFEATFSYAGDKLTKVTVKTTEPLDVNLEEFDIRPHDPGGKTLAALAPKVAKSAPVMIELTASPK